MEVADRAAILLPGAGVYGSSLVTITGIMEAETLLNSSLVIPPIDT